MEKFFYIVLLTLLSFNIYAQTTGKLTGTINTKTGATTATVRIEGTTLATTTDEGGHFVLANVPTGNRRILVDAIGYVPFRQSVSVLATNTPPLQITLEADRLNLNEVVVSATRYDVNRKQSPVIVNVIGSKLINATQSVAMSETLNYQPGVRLEVNCQNCGFTQVRMNGLDGAYSQILMNSRPIFSALNGVYGLDQIPTSMIERIEVVRGGGSALYGSNAIAGTINVITKDPVINSWEVANNTGLIDGRSLDNNLSFNTSVVSEDLTHGATFYGAKRSRQAYDADGDGFTEITELESTAFGSKAFFKFSELNKLTIDFSAIKEFRRGGDRLHLAPHFTDITEQLDHNTFMGGLTFDQYSKDYRTKYSAYASAQRTVRKSYYGGLGGERTAADSLRAANAYGTTKDFAFVGGGQLAHTLKNEDVFTTGIEYNHSQVDDEIPGYNRAIEQKVNSTGIYAQYEWKPTDRFKALLGGRFDHVNVSGSYFLGDINRASDVSVSAFSPRITLLYDIDEVFQLRGGYARGFRAPQAFDEDMHVSSVGGDQQFILMGEDLRTEFSNSYTASINFTKAIASTQANILVEGFFTDIRNPFTYVSQGVIGDNIRLQQMVNGAGLYVAGTNVEVGIAPSDRLTFQFGGTIQTNRYREDQELFKGEDKVDGDPAVFTRNLVRTPNSYGYLNTNWRVTEDFGVDVTGVYTGSMIVPHVVRESGFLDLVQSREFMEINLRLSRMIHVNNSFSLELSGGVQNIFNSYQNDFDRGAHRDSDYIYGPARPRTYFVGVKIGNFTH
ncbi:TonB-dependent receptor [Sphingobacterium sp. lm-10]|uniref:TonB-dependent receptor n=1 Tax=Sphingobacterium sp. lm-10 TaxID=2944904 RepID=UPI002020E9AF|nr:TonB-dependent receptor [Sphingobacterium sp. lm-10]MCL7989472.1 TonB-dependent receptor [Sphingobacterium sp. lm-10]